MSALLKPRIKQLVEGEEAFIYGALLYGAKGKDKPLFGHHADMMTLEECIVDYGLVRYIQMATKHKEYRQLRRLWAHLSPVDDVFPCWLPIEGEPTDYHWHLFAKTVAAEAMKLGDNTLWFFLAPKNW